MKNLRYIILIILYWLSLPIALAADKIDDLVAIEDDYEWIAPSSLPNNDGFIDSPANKLWGVGRTINPQKGIVYNGKKYPYSFNMTSNRAIGFKVAQGSVVKVNVFFRAATERGLKIIGPLEEFNKNSSLDPVASSNGEGDVEDKVVCLSASIQNNSSDDEIYWITGKTSGSVYVSYIEFKVEHYATAITLTSEYWRNIINGKIDLNPTITTGDGKTYNMGISWTSSDTNVIQVNENNELIPISIGESTLTATVRTDETTYISATTTVHVQSTRINSIKLIDITDSPNTEYLLPDPNSDRIVGYNFASSVPIDHQLRFEVDCEASDATYKIYEWDSTHQKFDKEMDLTDGNYVIWIPQMGESDQKHIEITHGGWTTMYYIKYGHNTDITTVSETTTWKSWADWNDIYYHNKYVKGINEDDNLLDTYNLAIYANSDDNHIQVTNTEEVKDGSNNTKYKTGILHLLGKRTWVNNAPVGRIIEIKVSGPGVIKVTPAEGNTANKLNVTINGSSTVLGAIRNRATEQEVAYTEDMARSIFVYNPDPTDFQIKEIKWTPMIATNLEDKTIPTVRVGAKTELTGFVVKNKSNVDVTDQGTFSFTGDNKYVKVIKEGDKYYMVGEKTNVNGSIFVKWTCNDNTYGPCEKSYGVTVEKGQVTLEFSHDSGTVSVGGALSPQVICTNSLNEKVNGLAMAYSVVSLSRDEVAQTVEDDRAVQGLVVGQVGVTASLMENSQYVQSGSYASNYTLTVEQSTGERLRLIPNTASFYSNNMSSMSWTNETNDGGIIVNLIRPSFVSDDVYMSSDNRFRFYPKNRDNIVYDDYGSGLFIKEKTSYLQFYAQGSATLNIKGFSSIPRNLEIWAISSEGFTSADPSLDDLDRAVLVGRISCDAGTFDASEEVNMPGNNYYFLKTANGGVYVSEVNWLNPKIQPTLIVSPNTYTMTHSTSAKVSLLDPSLFTIKAYLGEESVWVFNNASDATDGQKGNNSNARFTFESDDEQIATVNTQNGVVTPISRNEVKLRVILEAGTVSSQDYGKAQAEVVFNIDGKTADVHFNKDEIIYSSITSDKLGSSIWPTLSCVDHVEHTPITDGSITYSIEDLDGNVLTGDNVPEIDTSTGAISMYKVVNVDGVDTSAPRFRDGDVYRVVASFSHDEYVNQRAFYLLRCTDKITIPTVSYNAEDGVKEVNNAYSYTNVQIYREYYVPADKYIELTFDIPESNYITNVSGNVVSAMWEQPVNNRVIITGSKTVLIDNNEKECYTQFKIQVSNTSPIDEEDEELDGTTPPSGKAAVKIVWIHIAYGAAESWDGCYTIHFIGKPTATTTGDETLKRVSISSTNTGKTDGGTLYYTRDTSTPIASLKNQYTDPFDVKKNAIINFCEVFTPDERFTDGSSAFTSPIVYGYEVEITDNSVRSLTSGTSIALNPNTPTSKLDNQLLIPEDGNTELYMMMGVDGAYYYNGGFKQGGVVWKTNSSNPDPGIPSYVDIYKYYKAASNNGDDKDSNPRTEYNNDIGNKGSDTGAPYTTPVSGAFFRFEPEYNGVVSVWIRQNGASASNAWSSSHDDKGKLKKDWEKKLAHLTRRPVFIMDETGTLMQRNTAAYSADWEFENENGTGYRYINGTIADVSQQSVLDKDFMFAWNHHEDIEDANYKKYSRMAMEYYKYKYDFRPNIDEDFYIQENSTDPDFENVPITDIVYCDNADIDLVGQQFVLYGYELPMPNYVRYRIPVKAGKSYYMGGRQTKNAFCAVKFDNDHTTDNINSYELNVDMDSSSEDDDDNAWMSTLVAGTQINVKTKRRFEAGKWYPIVLPFSLSETRLLQIFGEEAIVLYLDGAYNYPTGFTMPDAVSPKTGGVDADLMFTRHFYQMLYANRPAFIRPSINPAYDDNGYLWFHRVTFEGSDIPSVDIGSGYEVVGSYETVTTNDEIYYLSNEDSGNAVMYHNDNKNKSVVMRPSRCWIQKQSSVTNAPPITHLGMNSFDGNSINLENVTDVIVDVMVDYDYDVNSCSDRNVYNLQGIVVCHIDEQNTLEQVRKQLMPGIYIYRNQKLYVR